MAARLETVRAKIGATLLDVLRPGWAEKIDLERLLLSSCSACVLGQLFGDYSTGVEKLFAIAKTDVSIYGDSSTPSCLTADVGVDAAASKAGFVKGFQERHTVGYGYYPNLTEAWKKEVLKRRSKRR